MRPAERLIGFPHAGGARVGGWRRRLLGVAEQTWFRPRVNIIVSYTKNCSELEGFEQSGGHGWIKENKENTKVVVVGRGGGI